MNNIQIIDNINLYPWNQLLNDSTSSLKIHDIHWKSVSHFVFANTLLYGLSKIKVSNTDDITQVRILTRELHYKDFLYNVRTAVIDAIEQTLNTNPEFYNALMATTGKSLVYIGPQTQMGMKLGVNRDTLTGDNILGETLMQIRSKFTNEANVFQTPEKAIMKQNTPINKQAVYASMLLEMGYEMKQEFDSPKLYEEKQEFFEEDRMDTLVFTSNVTDPLFVLSLEYEMRLDGKPFKYGIHQYIYYILYKQLTNPDEAYRESLLLNSVQVNYNQYEIIYEDLLHEYLRQSIETSLLLALPLKFESRYELYRILKSTTQTFEVRNQHPYMADLIDPMTNRILYDLKTKAGFILPYNVLNVNDILLRDVIVKEWIYTIRLPNILQNIALLANYYNVNPDLIVENVILLLYYPCSSIHLQDILVDTYPISFIEDMQTHNKTLFEAFTSTFENPSLYFIWCYISMLIRKLTQTASVDYESYLTKMTFKNGFRVSIDSIVFIICRLLYLIAEVGKTIYIPVHIDDNTFNVLQHILGIETPIPVLDSWNEFKIVMPPGISDTVPNIELWNKIEQFVIKLFPTILKYKPIAKKIYYLSEVIHAKVMKNKFNTQVYSRLYFYSP